MTLNNSKTEVVFLSSRFVKAPSFPKIRIGESYNESSSVARNLGVTIDRTLEMKDHVMNIVRPASFAIYKIGRLSKYLDRRSIKCLIHTPLCLQHWTAVIVFCTASLIITLQNYSVFKTLHPVWCLSVPNVTM